jgi:hypothetical protein
MSSSPSRVYCMFTKSTNCNDNVLGKSPIRDSNNRETGDCYWWIWKNEIQYTRDGETTRFTNKR